MTTTAVTACLVACGLLAALAAIQVGAAAGAPWGRVVWGGRHRVLPPRLRVASAMSVLLYAGFAAVLLSRVGMLPGGDSAIIPVLTWVLFAYFVVGIGMNAISRSRAEQLTMTPVCVVLAASTLVAALG